MPKFLLACLAALVCATALAAPPPLATESPLDKRVMALSEQLRCLVCQNQTIADSHAELAIDLKNQVREQLAQGKSDQEVIDYMVQRYGDFVLYKPQVKRLTWLLWFGPFLFVGAGLVLLGRHLGRRQPSAAALADADLDRAAHLLAGAPDAKEIP